MLPRSITPPSAGWRSAIERVIDSGDHDAKRPGRRSRAERGNEINSLAIPNLSLIQRYRG